MARSIASLHERITRGSPISADSDLSRFLHVFCSSSSAFSFEQTCSRCYDSQLRNILNEEWAAVRGYLRIEKGKINWFYDRDDPEEALIVDRLKQIYLLTDQNGTVLRSLHQVRTVRSGESARDSRHASEQGADLENQERIPAR